MADFWQVLTNPVALTQFPHTISAAIMFSAGVMIAASAWHLARKQNIEMMRPALKFGLWAMIIGFVASSSPATSSASSWCRPSP
jgi:cytochrome d ubiquinol oxidase subunit I